MSIAEFQEEYFNFLVALRDSGDTNMWGAGTMAFAKYLSSGTETMKQPVWR